MTARMERQPGTFTARYPGRCHGCAHHFAVGERLVLFADRRRDHRAYVHLRCAPPSRPGQPHCDVCLTALHQRETWDAAGHRRIPIGDPYCPSCPSSPTRSAT